MLSLLNHSCVPNVSVEHLDASNVMSLGAARDILKGEELTIEYVPKEGVWKERQDGLIEYGFECSCKKCLNEIKSK